MAIEIDVIGYVLQLIVIAIMWKLFRENARLEARVFELEQESDRRAAAEYEEPQIPRTF